MNSPQPGFRELPHTADWALEVWAHDFPALLEQAARGMYALTSAQLKAGPRAVRELELQGYDREILLVKFLTEILYFGLMEDLGFDTFDIRASETALHARLEGAPLESQSKEIKAVTYHHLAIRETERGLEVKIVFDV